jgi:hypothetical protein
MVASVDQDSVMGLVARGIIRHTMPLTAGAKLDGYEVLDLLGSGGMGEERRFYEIEPPNKAGHCEISNVSLVQASTSGLRLAAIRKRSAILLVKVKASPDRKTS